MQSSYDLFGQRGAVVTSNENTGISFKHVQGAGVLKQKSNAFNGKKKALGDVGNKIKGENKNISLNPTQKITSCGLPELTPKFKSLNLIDNKVKNNTNPRKIQNTTFKSTPSIKPAVKVPVSGQSKINVYVEELDDVSRKVDTLQIKSCNTEDSEENQVFISDYDSFEDDDDECEGPWMPKKFFRNKEELFNLCSVVPNDESAICALSDETSVTCETELDISLPVNEFDPFDLPLPIDVPLQW